MSGLEGAREKRLVRERALLVGLVRPADEERREAPLAELARLANTAGALVVERSIQKRTSVVPATYIGSGKAEELAETVEALDIDVVIVDHDLSPAQVRNLENILKRKVVDRSELILDIFATRARTRQSRVQVELAQLEYLRPRLRRMWTHLSRIEGGIGMRGPGETQIEVDRRIVRRRIDALKRELTEIERQHHTRASARRGFFSISLVGYTNAGKSTLLNRLTGAETLTEDRLFATLDTTTRAWELGDGKTVFLSDTVGFIRGLPHHLVGSFHATLEEAREADLLLHVVDAANPDAENQMSTVRRVLEDVGAGAVPVVEVLNKVDEVGDRLRLELLRAERNPSVAVSAATGEGVADLEAEVIRAIESAQVEIELTAHAGDGRLLAFLAEKGRILSRDYVEGDEVRIRARLPRRFAAQVTGERLEEEA